MNRRDGFSMLETLIATALLAIIVIASSSYLAKTNQDSQAQTVRDMQRVIYNKLVLSAQDPESIQRSALGIDPLGICLDLTDGAPCTVTSIANKQPFTLTSPDGTALAGPAVLLSVNGDDDCGPGGTGKPPCRFKPEATFWATCPLDPDTFNPQVSCLDPVAINIRVQVKSVGGTLMSKPIANYPRDSVFNNAAQPENFTFTTSVRDIKLAYKNPCPGNQVETFSGTTRVCRCPNGKLPGAGGACPDIRCPANQIMMGMLGPGLPKCVTPTNNELCWDLPDLRANGDCGVGAWLVRINYGTCRAGDASKGKGGSDEVTCDNDNGRCCMGTQ